MSETSHKQIRVNGEVQGVFFRQSAKQMADELHLNGYIKNNPDGTVEIEVEGASDLVEQFVTWCKTGPEQAKVEGIEVKNLPKEDLSGFSIRS